METHNNSAIMFHKSAHGQLSCWFKLWAFSISIFPFFFPPLFFLTIGRRHLSYPSNWSVSLKNACRTKAGPYVLEYRAELWHHNCLLPTLYKMSVHCDCDRAILRLELHHMSRMGSQFKHSKVVMMFWLRSGTFLWCCHDILLKPQQGVTYKNEAQVPKSLRSIKIVPTVSFIYPNALTLTYILFPLCISSFPLAVSQAVHHEALVASRTQHMCL